MNVTGTLQTSIGYQIVSNTVSASGTSPLVVTAEAPEGMRVTGGGFHINDTYGTPKELVYSRPTEDGCAWEICITHVDPIADVTAWAVCVTAD